MIGIGQIIGNYKIVAKLGSGGMGVVYLAEHPLIGKRVALKVIHRELSSNQEVVARFFNEARAVNAIGNAHIVEIVDFGQTQEGEFFLVMEHLQGEGLETRLKRERIDFQTALHIADQIAFALDATHAAGYIHRDIKPDNIFLTTRGNDRNFVKLLDFGLVKHMTSGGGQALTQQGVILGTPTYMSPEQCESRQVDYRADIYSLGVLLYEMLAGRPPFQGQSAGDIMVQQVAQAPMPPTQLVQGLPQSVERVVLRCLCKKPADRFQSMGELRVALRDPETYARTAPPLPPAMMAAQAPGGYGAGAGYGGPQAPLPAQQQYGQPQHQQQPQSYGQAAAGGGGYGGAPAPQSYGQPAAGGFGGVSPAAAGGFGGVSPGAGAAAGPAVAGPAQKTMFVDAQGPAPGAAGPGPGDAHFIQGKGAAAPAAKTMFLDGPPVLPQMPGGMGMPMNGGANGGSPGLAMPSPMPMPVVKPAGLSKPVPIVTPPPLRPGSIPANKGKGKLIGIIAGGVVLLIIIIVVATSGGGGDDKKTAGGGKADAGVAAVTERVRLFIKSDPDGADILVGGIMKGKTNGTVMLPKGGECEVTIRRSEYKEQKIKLDCSANGEPPLIKLVASNPEGAGEGSGSTTAVAGGATDKAAADKAAADKAAADKAAADKATAAADQAAADKAAEEQAAADKAAADKALAAKKKKSGGSSSSSTGKKKKGDGTMKPSFD